MRRWSWMLAWALACQTQPVDSGDDSAGPIDQDGDGAPAATDCDDEDESVGPEAAERCNGTDDDCDGLVDEADPGLADGATAYLDHDADGYGDDTRSARLCSVPEGFSATGGDCDDHDADSHPGGQERCGGGDEDCDGQVDEAGAEGELAWYEDADGDGHGNPAVEVLACDAGAGWAAGAGDCDDADPTVSPDAAELCGGADENCDGLVDDADPTVLDPGSWFADDDADGWGDLARASLACVQPAATAAVSGDCDDTRADVSPGATETCSAGDEDCDRLADDDDPSLVGALTWYVDGDRDGHGSSALTWTSCLAPPGFAPDSSDCDDDEAGIYVGAPETCDGVDQDCDSVVDNDAVDAPVWYADVDGDGHGDAASTAAACEAPAGYVGAPSDCNDADATVAPDAGEVCDDGVDQDCDGHERPCPFAASVGLGSTLGAWWLGETVDDRAGHSVAWVGDSNGDGQDEFVVGAYREDSWDSRAGAIYWITTDASGEHGLGSASAKFTGESAGDHAGSAAAGVGDVDGDGYDDLLIGAYLAAPSYSGAAYLVSGPFSSMNLSSATAILRGEDPDDEAGNSVAALGDVNADGYADFLVGSELHTEGALEKGGAAYVFYGPVSGTMSLASADARILGGEAKGSLGRGTGGGGDLDGDGQDDVLVGAPGAASSGAVYVFYSATLAGDVSVSVADAVITGAALGDQVGFATHILGDTNGDGYDDVGVGGPGYSTTETEAGAAWLVLGPPAGAIDSARADALLVGESGGDAAGCSVGSGDIDGDGRADILVGAWAEDEVGTTAGAVYLELGPFAGTYSLGDVYAKLVGSGASIETGRSVGGNGDIDGDGLNDILTGAPDLSPYENGAGGAFLLLAADL